MSFIKSIYQYFHNRKIKTLNDVNSTLVIDIKPKEYRRRIKIEIKQENGLRYLNK